MFSPYSCLEGVERSAGTGTSAASIRHRCGLSVARATGQSNLIGPLQLVTGVTHFSTGNLARAEQAFDAAMESAALTGSQETRGRILIYRTWVNVWTGDVDAALAFGRRLSP